MPEPAPPAAGQLLVRVKACGLNYPDLLIIEDKYQFRPERPFAPGCEIAGIVETAGAETPGFQAGDRVIAYPGWGGLAQKLVVPVKRCALMPREMPFEDGATFLIAYGTTHHAFKDRAKLQPGETVLVLGASGGTGLAAVQMGKAWGARVVAAVSSEEKGEMVRGHGADATVVYPPSPLTKELSVAFSRALKQAVGTQGADVIYDAMGGDYAEPALRAIAWKGRYLVVGFVAGIPRIPLNLTLLKGCDISGVFWGEFVDREPEQNANNLRELMDFYRRGSVRPAISSRFPFEQAREALTCLAERKISGKAVVSVE